MDQKMIILYIIFITIYSLKFQSFLMTLISIELIMLTTAGLLLIMLSKINLSYMLIYFLVMMVTEAVLGLSLLIMMSRIHYNDSTNILYSLSW